MANSNFTLSKDGIEIQFASNHLGHFYLTNLLLPIITYTSHSLPANTPSVRIVNVASIFHWVVPYKGIDFEHYNDPQNYNSWYTYGQTKLANILMAVELQKRLETEGFTNVKCNALHPGALNTHLFESSKTSFIPPSFAKMMFTSPIEGALTQLYAATSPKVDELDIKGQYLVPVAQIGEKSKFAQDEELAKKLWTWSVELIESKGFKMEL
jgi:NAD(P)-dependent dehydrogenase (short-subunit alcohol dehydrogenase family)